MTTINPRQIFLDTINSPADNALFLSVSPTLSSVGTMFVVKGYASPSSANTPLILHRTNFNTSGNQEYPVNTSFVIWVKKTTGALVAEGTYSSNVNSSFLARGNDWGIPRPKGSEATSRMGSLRHLRK
jgi:hypothetical protein